MSTGFFLGTGPVVLAGIFNTNTDTADLCFMVAWIALWVVGIVSLVNRNVWNGVTWIAVGFIPLGYLFLTP